MKKYAFRLETLRRVRRIEEDTAKAALLNANSAVQMAINAVEDRIADYRQSTFSNNDVSVSGVDDFMRRRYFNELAGQSLINARQDQANAEAVASIKREEWSAAAMKVKALDRLDEHRREEFRIEYDRELEKEVDDVVVSRAGIKPSTRKSVA